MSWFDLVLIAEAVLVLYGARAFVALKGEVVEENDALADELSRLGARLARQRARLRQLQDGGL